jgi:hypothetical protein
MTRQVVRYSGEELNWIKACADLPRRELHSLFVQIFGRDDVSFEHLKSLCTRRGWKTGRDGCFVKGQEPPNKGKRGYCAPGSEKGWFKKGQRAGNKAGIGHEYVDRDGYVMICVDQQNPWTGAATRMIHKHRWFWEQANGPVPAGYRLKCLDGDKRNTDPANWEAIPFALAPRLNGRFGRGYDTAPAELKPLIMATAKLEHAARSAQRGDTQ